MRTCGRVADQSAATGRTRSAGSRSCCGHDCGYHPPTQSNSYANYEIDRTVAYTRQPAGRLQRLSVAVLIDNLRTPAEDGKFTETPLTEEQMAKITTLVRGTVGFDETRGDNVSVVNQSFMPEAVAAAGEVAGRSIWEKPMVRDIARIVAGYRAGAVAAFGVRPDAKPDGRHESADGAPAVAGRGSCVEMSLAPAGP